MGTMKTKSLIRAAVLLVGCSIILLPAYVAAQSAGRIDFTARVAPTAGQAEPVRQLTFYLLRKSMEDIRAEAVQAAPGPDLEKFIGGLDVSPELKAWMMKHHSVRLSGEDFTKSLTPDDIVDVPEYFKAYMTHNEAFRGLGFPEPKFKVKDRNADPEKYQAQKEAYRLAVRNFIANAPDSVKGMDLELVNLNPYAKWDALETKQRQVADSRAFRLAQERYVVARTETDLEGHGSFSGVAPGKYWIGMLGEEAVSGDVRLRWDVPVMVRQGQTASVELSNFNAASSGTTAQNSNN
jgi:hypothetical protein